MSMCPGGEHDGPIPVTLCVIHDDVTMISTIGRIGCCGGVGILSDLWPVFKYMGPVYESELARQLPSAIAVARSLGNRSVINWAEGAFEYINE